MYKLNQYFFLLAMLAFCKTALADVSLPKVIGSNMVLQRDRPVTIWGNAIAGENITVTFHNQIKKTIAGADGKWMLKLDAMGADAKPATMIINGNNTIELENILVGEVWLCSGQSNMQYTMTKATHYAHAKKSSGLDSLALSNESNDNIRLFLVVRDLTKPDGGHVNKGWNPASGAPLGAFSAVGYHFAKNLYESLHIPIGMIASSVSGSNIDPWLDGTLKNATNSNSKNDWKIDANEPGKFYDGMISPLAPYTLKGFLWYQGETNCFLKEKAVYSFKFKHLINSWRSIWNDKEAPFYFVQIAPFAYSKSNGKVQLNEQDLPEFRQAQAAALTLPHTGMVVTTDLVDNISDIHPTYKWEVGRRLALLALANNYNKKIEDSGPVLDKMHIKDNRIVLEFSHKGEGLVSNNNKPLSGFEIAGSDGKFIPATAVIDNEKVIVSAAGVSNPRQVRFAWNEAAQPNFFNENGLPAVPFNTAYSLDK